MTDPMEPLKIIGQRAIEALAEIGLQVQNFAVLPNMEGGPNFAQIICSLDEAAMSDAVEDNAEKEETDRTLAEMERQMLREKEQEKAEAAAEGLKKLQQELESGKGVLGDEQ